MGLAYAVPYHDKYTIFQEDWVFLYVFAFSFIH